MYYHQQYGTWISAEPTGWQPAHTFLSCCSVEERTAQRCATRWSLFCSQQVRIPISKSQSRGSFRDGQRTIHPRAVTVQRSNPNAVYWQDCNHAHTPKLEKYQAVVCSQPLQNSSKMANLSLLQHSNVQVPCSHSIESNSSFHLPQSYCYALQDISDPCSLYHFVSILQKRETSKWSEDRSIYSNIMEDRGLTTEASQRKRYRWLWEPQVLKLGVS